jgi:hypothetical protein
MTADYSETEADPGDAEGKVLETLADGMPYAFVTATSLEPLNLRVASGHDADTIRALLTQTLRALPGGSDVISDGFHTFGELYDHRRALTAVLASAAATEGDSWRSKAHHPEDSPMFEGGYFIVGIKLPTGTITYHYKLSHWDDFAAVPELEHAPKWDGAAPGETVDRLMATARLVAEEIDRA